MGIQINGNNDIISALDGSWTAEGASINTSGILTATTFTGNVTGTACTFVDGKFTGNVTIGGTLTYEDVTNIDSVGVITARDGVNVTSGSVSVTDGYAYRFGDGSYRIEGKDDGANARIGFLAGGSERLRITPAGAVQIGNLQTSQNSTTHTSATKLHIDSTKSIKIARLGAGSLSSAGWYTVARISSGEGNYFKCYVSLGGNFTQDMCVMELTGSWSASGGLSNAYTEPVFTAHRTGAHSTDRITRARFVKDGSNVTYLQIYIAAGVDSNTWGKSVLEYQIGAYSQNTADSNSYAMFAAQASGLTGIRTLEVDDNALCTNAGSYKFYSGGNATERLTITSTGEVNIGGNYTQTTVPLAVTTSANNFGIRLLTGTNSVCDILNNDSAGNCEIRGYYNNNSGSRGEGFRLESSGDSFFNGGHLIVGGTSFGASSTFSVASGGQFRSVLAQNTAGTSLIGAISGVSNGFEINVDSSQNQNYKFHNGSANNVTINQYGQVLIKTTSTANAHANADDLIIGDTGSDQRSGITIVSDTDKDGAIHFSDGTGSGQLRGQIVYGHTFGSYSDVLAIYTGGSSSMLIQEDGDVVLGEIGSTRYTEGSTSAQLRVVGNADSGRPGAISLMGFGNTSNEAHARINFQQQTSGTNGQTTARIEAINRSAGEDASDLVFYTEKTGQDLKECARMTTKGELLINRTDTVSTNLSFDSLHLGIGGNYGPNLSYRTIGFGYRANETSEYPASIGCQITDWASNTKADLVFATRNSTGQSDVATERLRIKAVGESAFSGPVEINGGTFNASTDATLKIIASTNNDWGILVNKYTGSATEYGINVDISKNAAYAYRIRGNGSQTYTIDGAGATTHNMWADAPAGFVTGGLTKYTDAVAEYHYTWAQSGQEDYYIDLTCGSYFQAEFIYTSDQSNGGNLVEQYARGNWANNHTTHRGMMHEWIGGGGNLITTFTVSDQSGNGSVDVKGGMTQMGSAGASYRGYYGGGHEGSGGTNNGRLRIAEDKNNASASVGNRSLIVKVYYGSFSISKSVQ